jgi:hypothetical protein
MRKRIRKTKTGWRVTGGEFSYYEMMELAANLLRAVNGKDALVEEVPKSYSPADKLVRMTKSTRP